MFAHWTDDARRLLSHARSEAFRLGSDSCDTEHLLLGALVEDGGVAHRVFQYLDRDRNHIRAEIEKVVPRYPRSTSGTLPPALRQPDQLELTSSAKTVMQSAAMEAAKLGHNYLGTEHLLLALGKEFQGRAARALLEVGVDPEEDIREAVLAHLGMSRQYEDLVFRALGILRHASWIGLEEARVLVRRLARGVHRGILREIDESTLVQLFDDHRQEQAAVPGEEPEVRRARHIRQQIGGK